MNYILFVFEQFGLLEVIDKLFFVVDFVVHFDLFLYGDLIC